MKKFKALVIIPTYNEAHNIEPIIKAIFDIDKKISRYTLEVLVVDDKSPDGTGTIVRRLQQSRPQLHLLSGRKAGLGKAHLRGFRYGLRARKYDVFITMDADFSHNPTAIPALLKAIDRGDDYVIGSRYVRGGTVEAGWPLRRRIISLVANTFARMFVDAKTDIRDLTGGFKAIRASALEQIDLDQVRASGNVFIVSLLHQFSLGGFRLSEVPITFIDRRYGASKLRFRNVLEFAYITYQLNPQSRIRRFIRFGLVGACGTIVNLAVLVGLVRLADTPVLAANAIAIEVSIIGNFFLNHLYTFRAAYTAPRSNRRDAAGAMVLKLVKYNLVALGGAAISFAVFYVCYDRLGLNYILADLTAIIIAMSWNYFMSVRIVWKVVDD